MSPKYLFVAIIILAPRCTAIEHAGGVVEVFNPSARDESMGGSFALAEPGPFVLHGNPATMTRATGVAAGYSHSQLIPDLADDVFIDHWGLAYSDGRWAVGGMYSLLDQGKLTGRDENGNPTGEYESKQTNVQLGLGLHLSSFFSKGRQARTQVRIGANVKQIKDELVPVATSQDPSRSSATAVTLDCGAELSIRLSSGDSDGMPRSTLRVAGTVDDLLHSELEFENATQSDPLQRFAHAGAALDLEFLPHPVLGSLVGLTLQYEESRSLLPHDDTKIFRTGTELNFAQLLSIRVGYTDDSRGGIQAPTVGGGLRLGWLGFPAALRLDYASRPQASTLSRVDVYSVQGSWNFGS